jgi:hypothetical protein
MGWGLLDPIGGMVLSLYIVIEWIKTLLQNFANREFLLLTLIRVTVFL